MPRKLQLTWDKSSKRWKKFYRGKQYYFRSAMEPRTIRRATSKRWPRGSEEGRTGRKAYRTVSRALDGHDGGIREDSGKGERRGELDTLVRCK